MTTTVSFELAKLLKEKGFVFRQNETYYNPVNGFTKYKEITPTIAEVVMWLYEKYGIWVYVIPPSKTSWYYNIESLNESFNKETKSGYSSPTESYEAAILHCLTNFM